MRCVAGMLFCAGVALAQHVTTLDNLPAPVRNFSGNEVHPELPCDVAPVKPALNFGARFQAGYVLRTSLGPYQNGKHHWYIVFRVTPEGGGQPIYFMDSIDLPPVLQPDFDGEASGTFLMGEGRYDVKWSLLDDLGRVCRQQWTIDAHLNSSQRSTKVAIPPGVVGDISWRPAPVAGTDSAAKPRRATLLLNAALPVTRRAGRPRPGQANLADSALGHWGTLLSILASLLQRMTPVTVRLVVFNLDQQRELFRQEDFTADEIDRIAHAADGMEQWAVDYHVLLKPLGGWDLLSDLETKEIHATAPSDTVIFLGLPQASPEKMPSDMPGAESAQRFFYLQYRPALWGPDQVLIQNQSYGPARMRDPIMPSLPSKPELLDPIEESVRRLKGRIILVSSPAGFTKAIDSIEQTKNR